MTRVAARFFVLVLATSLAAGVASAGLEKDGLESAKDSFNEQMRSVRSTDLLRPTNYIEKDGISYAYYVPARLIRLAKSGEKFKLRKTHYSRQRLEFELESSSESKVRITIQSPYRLAQIVVDEVAPTVLSEVFVFGERPELLRFVRNTRSTLFHLGGCNHLPPEDQREVHPTYESAVAAGASPCSICFSEHLALPIDGYGPVRASAIELARLHEIAFPPIEDEDIQEMIRRRGEAMVDRLPITPAGYDYEFKVLRSELPSARSFLTGFVYVTDRLLEAVENPVELDFVLAHEIAHVELGWKENDDSAKPVPGIGVVEYQASLSQSRELAADLLAGLMVGASSARPEVAEHCAQSLRKIQFFDEAVPVEKQPPRSSHPTFARRLRAFDSSRFGWCHSSDVYCGLNEDGNPLVRARVVGKCLVGDAGNERAAICILIETTDLAEKPYKIAMRSNKKIARLTLGENRTVDLFLLDDNKRNKPFRGSLAPGYDVNIVVLMTKNSKAEHFEEIDVNDVQQLEFSGDGGIGVKQWVRCNDG